MKKLILAGFSSAMFVVFVSSCLAAQAVGPHGSLNMTTLVWNVVILIGLGIVFGILYYIVGEAPLIPDKGKKLIQYLILLIGALAVIFFILRFIGIA